MLQYRSCISLKLNTDENMFLRSALHRHQLMNTKCSACANQRAFCISICTICVLGGGGHILISLDNLLMY